MKPIQISEDILPISQFKAHASRIIRELQESERPIVITHDGRAAAVLLSPQEFDRLSYRARFVRSVEAGLADTQAGRMTSDEEFESELEEEFAALGDI